MSLLEPPQHLAHHAASLIHRLGLIDARPKFLVHRLPVQTARILLPMLVAHGGPDFFERGGVELLQQRDMQKTQPRKQAHNTSVTGAPARRKYLARLTRRAGWCINSTKAA